ncbi:hypothetical protein SUDANB1_05654 [Streptomyces sp. enrichment culture]|uniref:hypothetical protein n=1 Tax=Streptomyces sp. enrichment culture TaxID=1795815 RepID=UPI003F5801A4
MTGTTDTPAVSLVTVTAWKNLWGGNDGLSYLGRQVVASRVVAGEDEFKAAWDEFGTHPETSYRAARPAVDRHDVDRHDPYRPY